MVKSYIRICNSVQLVRTNGVRNRGQRKQESRTKVCLMCKPMNLASILPKMRWPLPTKNIYVLKNKRELRLVRQAMKEEFDVVHDKELDEMMMISPPLYKYKTKITVKSKHRKSATGKRCRRSKFKWKIHNDDIDLSLWKRHKIGDLDEIASRSFNRDINAAINIRTLSKYKVHLMYFKTNCYI